MRRESFQGYVRPDGSVGIRNHVAVIPTVACANGVAEAVCREVKGTVPLLHGHGCGRALEIGMHQRALSGQGLNPNVAAALVIGLGCETIHAEAVAAEIAKTGKPVEFLVIQNEGGSRRAARKGIQFARKMADGAAVMKRTRCPVDRITLGLQCGGSDAFSGVTANPAVGLVTDWLVERGGTAILTETTEMIGTAHILSRRARTPEVGQEVVRIIEEAHKRSKDIMGPLASLVIAPGNMDGGMSSIQEKSLGCICKAGSGPITEVVEYGRAPTEKGLVIMNGPGYDMESMAGLGAAGCQLMVFTTGRGTPAGFATVPVIKVSSTSRLSIAMEDDIDVNAGAVLEGQSLERVADEIIELALDVMDGRKTKAELNRQGSILCLATVCPAF
ncbi:MAG: UxaA family hydrolase [Syntrophaceae bacterium]|nr:UxaA family hydrolase [Deltaproteobacteria bacterium]